MFRLVTTPYNKEEEPKHDPRVPAHHIDQEWLQQQVHHLRSQQDTIIHHLQRTIPKYVDERLYAQNSTEIDLMPQSNNLELIYTIFVVVTAAGGGTLAIADRSIPLPQGNTTISVQGGAGFILRDTDIRKLTQSTAGQLAIECFGIELPNSGVW